jgi:hypothetical protein
VSATQEAIELGWKQEGVGKALSNLWPYPFVLDAVECGSMEGFLQSLKLSDPMRKADVARLSGFPAYKTGQEGNGWKADQLLHWNGSSYERLGVYHHALLDRAYDACLEQNPGFAEALQQTGCRPFSHAIGKHDPRDTTLTAWEYLYSMYRLRSRLPAAI